MATYNSMVSRTNVSPLIPEEYSREIWKSAPEYSAALRMFRHIQLSAAQHRVPVLSVLPQAYFVSGDTGLKQTTSVEWANKYLNVEEIAAIVPVPEAVLADSKYDLWAEIMPLLVEAIGVLIDGAVFFGTNKPASWPNAIEDGAAASSNTYTRGSVAGQDLAEDVNQLMKLVETDGFDVNGFIAHPAIKSDLRGLRDANKNLLFIPGLTAGTPSTLYGEPIQYLRNGSFDTARADILAGDMSKAIIGMRQDITWKFLDQSVISDDTGKVLLNLAQQDSVALRVVLRLAFQVANPINRLQQVEASRYPFAVLRPKGFVGP